MGTPSSIQEPHGDTSCHDHRHGLVVGLADPIGLSSPADSLMPYELDVGSPTYGSCWPCWEETCSFSTHSYPLPLCHDGSCMIAVQSPLGVPEVGRADVTV